MTTDHGSVPVAQVQVRYDLAPLAQLTDGRNAGSWFSAQPGPKEELSTPWDGRIDLQVAKREAVTKAESKEEFQEQGRCWPQKTDSCGGALVPLFSFVFVVAVAVAVAVAVSVSVSVSVSSFVSSFFSSSVSQASDVDQRNADNPTVGQSVSLPLRPHPHGY